MEVESLSEKFQNRFDELHTSLVSTVMVTLLHRGALSQEDCQDLLVADPDGELQDFSSNYFSVVSVAKCGEVKGSRFDGSTCTFQLNNLTSPDVLSILARLDQVHFQKIQKGV